MRITFPSKEVFLMAVFLAFCVGPASVAFAIQSAGNASDLMNDQTITDTVERELGFALAVPSSRIDVVTTLFEPDSLPRLADHPIWSKN